MKCFTTNYLYDYSVCQSDSYATSTKVSDHRNLYFLWDKTFYILDKGNRDNYLFYDELNGIVQANKNRPITEALCVQMECQVMGLIKKFEEKGVITEQRPWNDNMCFVIQGYHYFEECVKSGRLK